MKRNLLFLVSKIHETGSSFVTEELKNNGATGLVPSHGDILACLYKYEKMTMKNIAEKIHRTRPTVTVLVDKLEKNGFVKREVSTKDSRYTYISLTQKGKDFQIIFEKISDALNDKLYKNLSENEADTIENLLSKIIK